MQSGLGWECGGRSYEHYAETKAVFVKPQRVTPWKTTRNDAPPTTSSPASSAIGQRKRKEAQR